ncbi:hypothetical protein NKH18_16270 [Streptomyces sp. M10(2022)]
MRPLSRTRIPVPRRTSFLAARSRYDQPRLMGCGEDPVDQPGGRARESGASPAGTAGPGSQDRAPYPGGCCRFMPAVTGFVQRQAGRDLEAAPWKGPTASVPPELRARSPHPRDAESRRGAARLGLRVSWIFAAWVESAPAGRQPGSGRCTGGSGEQ